MTLVERYTGCLLGLAVGDALGAPFVALTAEQIKELGGCGEFLPSLSAAGVLVPLSDQGETQRGDALEAGQWTEDTQLAIALAGSMLAEAGHFIPESWGHALVQWLNGEPRAPGTSSIQSALQLRTGAVFWDEAADPEGAGAGPAARVAPVALLYANDGPLRQETATVQALVTHGHPDAQAAAVAVSEAVALSLAGAGGGVELLSGIIDVLADGPTEWEEFQRCLEVVSVLLADEVEPAAAIRVLGTSGWCREAVPCALYCAARPGDTFEQALCRATTSGGAADTIGAITGAIAGARRGLAAIPARWQYRVEGADILVRFARALWRMSAAAQHVDV